MREYLTRLFNDLPIERKLLLVFVIPLTALILLSAVTYESVQTVERDEEQLNRLYLTQKSAAQYMRLIVDLETSFRGYVLTLQRPYLRPFRTAQEGIFSVGEELTRMVSDEVAHRPLIVEVQSLVKQLIIEKVELIEAAQKGHPEKALQYIEEGHGRTIMVRIRELMVRDAPHGRSNSQSPRAGRAFGSEPSCAERETLRVGIQVSRTGGQCPLRYFHDQGD
ncbi:MAG: CHASE3 domain-containing protein [Nitrospirae bacterium]|nr:CHASE3 domain-containing protein [Nitrospirota bacterium]